MAKRARARWVQACIFFDSHGHTACGGIVPTPIAQRPYAMRPERALGFPRQWVLPIPCLVHDSQHVGQPWDGVIWNELLAGDVKNTRSLWQGGAFLCCFCSCRVANALYRSFVIVQSQVLDGRSQLSCSTLSFRSGDHAEWGLSCKRVLAFAKGLHVALCLSRPPCWGTWPFEFLASLA